MFKLNDKPHAFLKNGKNDIKLIALDVVMESADYAAIKANNEMNEDSELVIEGIQSLKGMMFNEEEE